MLHGLFWTMPLPLLYLWIVIILMDFGLCMPNFNGLWTMYCVICVDFGHELCVKWCICHCFVELYICYAL